MTNKNKPPKTQLVEGSASQDPYCYEGERLASLLQSIQREIKASRLLDRYSLPEKLWFKQQFSIGVNDVTRVLERMSPSSGTGNAAPTPHICRTSPSVQLQAVLLASDCNPRWLTKHLPSLALSRDVPIISVKDKGEASLRLGQLVNLKTAIAIGVKAKGNAMNKLFEEILDPNDVGSDLQISSEMHVVQDS